MIAPLATSFAYQSAFEALEKRGLAESSRVLFNAHYAMPNHVSTMRHLAAAIGERDPMAGNRLYGNLASRIRRELGLMKPRIALWTIATWPEEPIGERREFSFRMRPEVVEALERLGWVVRVVFEVAKTELPTFAVEGGLQQQLRSHRKRERLLRDAKIADILARSHDGKLCCQIEGCGFDFESVYGNIGKGYIQVHHLNPLGLRDTSELTRLDDLMIVCANCHAMLHRELEVLSPEKLILNRLAE